MNRSLLYCDVETAPLPEECLRSNGLIPPFEPPGNVKDPEKIEIRRLAHESKCIEDAALSPLTGTICAIGYALGDEDPEIIHVTDVVCEKAILHVFWRQIRNVINAHGQIVGWNLKGFDLPFLYRRSMHLGVNPVLLKGERGWNDNAVCDLRLWWTDGNRTGEGTLDAVSRFILGEGKTGDGKDFHKLLKADPVKAKEYLTQDVRLVQRLHPILTMQPVKKGEEWE